MIGSKKSCNNEKIVSRMLCMEECVTALIFVSCAEENPAADVSSFFMNKSMEGDGAEEV